MSDPDQRINALGNQLVELHQRLRFAVSDLAGNISDSLAAHCVAFCSALQRHHDGEEAGLFPYLERHRPDLRPLIAELRRDHEQLAALIRRTAADPSPTELATLRAVMESHFTYEERRLVPLLNSLPGDPAPPSPSPSSSPLASTPPRPLRSPSWTADC